MNKILLSAFAASMLFASCSQQAKQEECKLGLCPDQFGTAQVDGKDVKLFTLTNKNGMVAQVTNLGAKVVSLYAPNKNGEFADVVMGYATAAEYAACDNATGVGESFFGATIGRYGNRIANGKFSIDGTEYELNINENGVTTLHGGNRGFYSVVWDANQTSENSIEFKYLSADGEMGFPGNLNVKVTFTLCDCNSLKIEYEATTDKATVVNLTNHSYFNLAGESSDSTINNHIMKINADNITPVDAKLIPTGELMPVAGTAFDFNTPHAIADSIASEHEQMKLGAGYDHNWVLSAELDSCGLREAAVVKDPISGRVMTVLTNEPGIQFYGGNFINGTQKGKCGKMYQYRGALCLETQHFPDSPNHENFPSTVLRPGETFKSVCVYKFTAE